VKVRVTKCSQIYVLVLYCLPYSQVIIILKVKYSRHSDISKSKNVQYSRMVFSLGATFFLILYIISKCKKLTTCNTIIVNLPGYASLN